MFRGEFEQEVKGQKAMSVKDLVGHAITGIEAGTVEIRPGLSNILRIMSRVAPGFALAQLAKSFRPDS